ncbi:hypothetical protein [Schumannella soli]|uniref:Uncharacterized protein n=1 Tax=Schumannella soli TaxID=2590779 RepID=A0A506Y078_9MICO|nr:hypothetical protein [Schumannella soli]TPW75906.1 hypothetical protein FJ657_08645 [Schumannella soli]
MHATEASGSYCETTIRHEIRSPPMKSVRRIDGDPRRVLGVAIIAALLTLSGCSATAGSATDTTHKPAAHTPTTKQTAASYTTQTTSEGHLYTDALAGYAVAYPGEPEVKPLAIEGTDRLANFAAYGDETITVFGSRGEVRDSPPDLHGELLGWLQSVDTSGQIGASSDILGGLPALRADFTATSGEVGETMVASDGDTFFQLIAVGGTPEQRQAFFGSFRQVDG